MSKNGDLIVRCLSSQKAEYARIIASRCKENPRTITYCGATALDEADSRKLTSIGAQEAKRILDELGLP